MDKDMRRSLNLLESGINILVSQRDGWMERAKEAEAELVALRAMRDRLNDDALANCFMDNRGDTPAEIVEPLVRAVAVYRAAVLGVFTP